MKESTIIENESKHLESPDGYRTMYVYHQGAFLRAYGFSAFLLNRYSPQDLKPQKVVLKDKSFKIFTGFPEASKDKFLAIDGCEIRETDESITVILPASLFSSEEDTDTLAKDYDNWVSCISCNTPDAKPAKTELPTGTLMSVISELLHYPVEQKSLLENTTFLMNIRQKLIKLI